MEAVIFVGIQAVGKSTFYKERFFNTHIRINMDMLKTRHREKILVQACLDARQPFVIDNTNPTVEDRARYIPLARAAGFCVCGYYFQSSSKDAIDRNSRRPEAERVPEKGILGTFNRLQLPSLNEGFDRLFYVRINEVSTFMIEEWLDEVR
jgi:predicted kinase